MANQAAFDAQSKPPLIHLKGIAKSFGSLPVLQDVDLEIHAGTIHALIGANGAGKSTLGKIIAGYYRRDEGEMTVNGHSVAAWSPDRALAAGIAMIHQEIQLVPGLSVADNVFLGQERQSGGFLRSNAARYSELDARIGFGIPGDVETGSLPLHVQQQIEIMRALARDARVIVMDEPTAALGPQEAERLHHVMHELAAKGCAIVYVTHFLDHVLAHCGHVTVMRDGRVIQSRLIAGLTRDALVETMLGAAFTATFSSVPPPSTEAEQLLDVRHLSVRPMVREANLNVRRGEIVGLLGLAGSGRSELLRALAGLTCYEGEATFNGRALPNGDRHRVKRRGLVMVPEDRRGQGILMDGSIRENTTLPYLHRFARMGFISRKRERAGIRPFLERFGVHPADPEMNIRGHSGGNQQKVLLARWLLDKPQLIMLDEPTRGIDVGARQRIYAAIAEMAASGMGVLLVSSDFEEVLGLSHRAYLLRDGITLGELNRDQWTPDDVLRALFAAEEGNHP